MRGQEALMGPEGRLSANYQKIAVGGVFDLTNNLWRILWVMHETMMAADSCELTV